MAGTRAHFPFERDLEFQPAVGHSDLAHWSRGAAQQIAAADRQPAARAVGSRAQALGPNVDVLFLLTTR